MDANTRKIERIFDSTITYQVPLFQRPYVWTKEKNWEPLWEDIQALLDKHLRGAPTHPHFLGAVVLEQLANPTGSIESRQVIDGQQRFTTLQLFLIAARDQAAGHFVEKHVERFGDLISNRRSRVDHDDEVFKVWPTNSNRAAFRAVHQAGSPQSLARVVAERPELDLERSNIIDGYRFFYSQIDAWLKGEIDDEQDVDGLSGKTLDDRFDTLWYVVKECLQLVVIDLGPGDETQVIFETLNARGEDLLPADLIKNFLFRRAENGDSRAVERLYADHWHRLEEDWWRSEVKQGRMTRPRVDVFINFYLAMMTREEVKLGHLFNAFKAFVLSTGSAVDDAPSVPRTASDHIALLARYSDIYKQFANPTNHPRLATFLSRMKAVDTTTVYPFLLYAYGELVPHNVAEFDRILGLIESYLMRRMICGMTTKSYNRYFIEMIRSLDKAGSISAANVAEYMGLARADSTLFPDDTTFERAVSEWELYGRLAQYKVRAILEALDTYVAHRKSEEMPLPDGLTIEHVMPREWKPHWPLPEEARADPIVELKSVQRRERLINSIGNLTLITGSLNPALSNGSWETKRPELLKFSRMNLTKYFHEPAAEVWTEEAIERRTLNLLRHLKEIWPSLEGAPV